MSFTSEVESGQRFEFGKNWLRFLNSVSDERVAESERGIIAMLGDIRGKTFLDVGCGSGLSSLAAHRLGAKVRSFDYDPQSVACTRALQKMYGVSWPVEEGSTLDPAYLARLGKFDIVYSWGVLHHTGDMWSAMEAVSVCVNDTLFIAIYNDAHRQSRIWRYIKRLYNATPSLLRWALTIPLFIKRRGPRFVIDTLKGRPLGSWKSSRGMTPWIDFIDWMGGYPYEFARPDEVFNFWRGKGLTLEKMTTTVGLGCNEFVFRVTR